MMAQTVFNITKTGKENEPELLGKLVGEEILKQSGKNFIKKDEYNFYKTINRLRRFNE